jgi:hypothetical protein
MGQWPKAMGWTSCPEAMFINAVPAKGTNVNVKLSRPIYKSKLDCRHNIYKFWAAAAGSFYVIIATIRLQLYKKIYQRLSNLWLWR